MEMDTPRKRGKKPLDYTHFLEAEAVYLAGKSAEAIAAFHAMPETDKKRTLAQIKNRLKQQAEGNQSSDKKNLNVLDLVDELYKSIKKEGDKLTEKQLERLLKKLEDVNSKMVETKEVVKKKEFDLKRMLKTKKLAKKKAALETLKKEINRLEARD